MVSLPLFNSRVIYLLQGFLLRSFALDAGWMFLALFSPSAILELQTQAYPATDENVHVS